MNLIINLIFLLIVLVYGKKFANSYSTNLIYNNLVLIAILILANSFYRIAVNLYLKKEHSVTNIITESLTRSLVIIGGIILLNYLFANPTLLNNFGITFDIKNIQGDFSIALVSLIPYFLYKITYCLFVYSL
jgi:riboflavin transporter FmnP